VQTHTKGETRVEAHVVTGRQLVDAFEQFINGAQSAKQDMRAFFEGGTKVPRGML
jgi:hypothetical protein